MSFRLELEPEDLRRGGGSVAARRWGMILGVVVMVMVGSAAGLWAAYHVISHRGAIEAVPLIRADEQPVKVPPANPGGLEVPDQNVYILNHDQPADSRVEQLLPQPETPLPRPSPAEPPVTETAPPVAVPAGSASASAPIPAAPAVAPQPAPMAAPPIAPPPAPASAPIAAAPAAAPPATQAAAPALAAPPVPAPPPTPKVAVAAAPPSAAAPARKGAYRLQVGAVRSTDAAQHEWERLKRTDPDVLGKLSAVSERIDEGARGVFYRIIAGSYPDAAAAEHACDELKRHKVGCILVKP